MENSAALTWPFQLRQLAVMIDAGISIDAALTSLESRLGKGSEKLQRASQLVKRGVSLPDAFRRSKIIGEFDHAMLMAADNAGCLPEGLNHISESRVSQLQRANSFKASLVFPKAMMLIGALAGIFVRTSSGQQSVAEATISVGLVFGCFYLVCLVSLYVVRADVRIWMSWLWPYPVIRKIYDWYCLALEYYFYNSLIWQVSAGVSASDATKNCSHLLLSKSFQHSVVLASEAMANGQSLNQALVNEGLVLTDRMRQVLLVADQSGLHEKAIKHELKLQRGSLKLKADNFFKWAPRAFYLLSLVFISKFIFV